MVQRKKVNFKLESLAIIIVVRFFSVLVQMKRDRSPLRRIAKIELLLNELKADLTKETDDSAGSVLCFKHTKWPKLDNKILYCECGDSLAVDDHIPKKGCPILLLSGNLYNGLSRSTSASVIWEPAKTVQYTQDSSEIAETIRKFENHPHKKPITGIFYVMWLLEGHKKSDQLFASGTRKSQYRRDFVRALKYPQYTGVLARLGIAQLTHCLQLLVRVDQQPIVLKTSYEENAPITQEMMEELFAEIQKPTLILADIVSETLPKDTS